MKYELDREPGLLNPDRVLYTTQDRFQNIDELPKHVLHDMEHFFLCVQSIGKEGDRCGRSAATGCRAACNGRDDQLICGA